MPETKLKKILTSHFIKYSLIPIFVVEVALLILYFAINAYIALKNTDLLLNEAQSHTEEVLKNESKIISDKLNEVSRLAKVLQFEHEAIIKNPNGFGLPNGKPSFDVAENGVFYKTNKVGSSLYYSANTKMNEEQIAKATYTEAMDISFKSIVDTNDNIVAAYYNTWDDMNRLYPFIDKVYEQYGAHINMEDYNFYFLADEKHNPERKPAWTSAYLDPAGNGWMLSCVVPIYKDDTLEGVTGLDITIDSFVKNILNRELPYNANIFMVDDKGMIIAMNEKIEKLLGLKELKEHLYTDAILKTIEKPEEFNILKNKSPFASHFKNLFESESNIDSLKIKDSEYLTLMQNVDETNWKLMVLVDKAEIFSSIVYLKELSNKIGFVAIGFLLLFYVVFFVLLFRRINNFSEIITEPIEKLSNETSKITDTSQKIQTVETDITEIHQLNSNFTKMMKELNTKTENLFEAKKEAEELSRAKDDFLANMSHELKTPLNSINVISSVMKRNKASNLDDKQIKNLNIIHKCGEDLLFLINDVLDISKLESGHLVINNDKVDLSSLISSIYDMFYPQVKNKDLDFVFKMDSTIKYVFTDPDRLKQIIKNLLSNALKFTQEGKISFIVSDLDDKVKISIIDEGIGIAKDKQKYIFDRFKQVDGSTTRVYGGTGLGLAISKELTQLLDGEISVSSEEGKGSTFEVIIPKKLDLLKGLDLLTINNNEEKSEEKKVVKDEENKSFNNSEIKNQKILVYNNDNANFLFTILELKKAYEVKQFDSLDELIKEYQNDNQAVFINQDPLKEEECVKVVDNFKQEDLIIVFDNEVNDKFSNLAAKKIKKPFKIDHLTKEN